MLILLHSSLQQELHKLKQEHRLLSKVQYHLQVQQQFQQHRLQQQINLLKLLLRLVKQQIQHQDLQ